MKFWSCLHLLSVGIIITHHYFSQCSIADKRYNNRDNSYKRKLWIGPGLEFQRFSSLPSRQEVLQHTGRHGTKSEVENSTCDSTGNRKRGTFSLEWTLWNPKAYLQGHTSYNKATPPHPFQQCLSSVTKDSINQPVGAIPFQTNTTSKFSLYGSGNWMQGLCILV